MIWYVLQMINIQYLYTIWTLIAFFDMFTYLYYLCTADVVFKSCFYFDLEICFICTVWVKINEVSFLVCSVVVYRDFNSCLILVKSLSDNLTTEPWFDFCVWYQASINRLNMRVLIVFCIKVIYILFCLIKWLLFKYYDENYVIFYILFFIVYNICSFILKNKHVLTLHNLVSPSTGVHL